MLFQEIFCLIVSFNLGIHSVSPFKDINHGILLLYWLLMIPVLVQLLNGFTQIQQSLWANWKMLLIAVSDLLPCCEVLKTKFWNMWWHPYKHGLVNVFSHKVEIFFICCIYQGKCKSFVEENISDITPPDFFHNITINRINSQQYSYIFKLVDLSLFK